MEKTSFVYVICAYNIYTPCLKKSDFNIIGVLPPTTPEEEVEKYVEKLSCYNENDDDDRYCNVWYEKRYFGETNIIEYESLSFEYDDEETIEDLNKEFKDLAEKSEKKDDPIVEKRLECPLYNDEYECAKKTLNDRIKEVQQKLLPIEERFSELQKDDEYLPPNELIEDFVQTVKSFVRSTQKTIRESITDLGCLKICIDRGENCKDKISELKQSCRAIDEELDDLILSLFNIEGVIEQINI